MAYEYVEIGATPCDEPCQQIGTKNYDSMLARAECGIYLRQLERFISAEKKEVPEDFRLIVKGNPHDFGNYYEVVAKFNDSNDKCWDLAMFLENNSPTTWDDAAKIELARHKSVD